MTSAAHLGFLLGLTTVALAGCGGDDPGADGSASGSGDAGDGGVADSRGSDSDAGNAPPFGDNPGAPGVPDVGSNPVLMVGGPEPRLLEEVDDGWEVLLTADWEMEAMSEGYWCVRATLDRDVYFGATVPLSPPGTHHTLLSVASSPSGPDGVERCSAGTNGDVMIAGSGVGTDTLAFPEGVAMLAPAGSQLILNLHLYNPTTETLSGRSGTLVKSVDADDVDELAETTLAGPIRLDIPTGRVVQTGECTLSRDINIIAVSPHMHQIGVYMKAVAHNSEVGDVVLYDDAYSFYEQRIYPMDLVPMKAGDTIDVECTYENDTGQTIGFGDSSFDEMCFASLFHYPQIDSGNFICPL